MVSVNILDASALINGGIPKDKNITVEEVYEEVMDERSKLEMELNSIQVERADEDYLKEITEVAEETGDIHKLSIADKKLLALALEYHKKEKEMKVITDDYAIQNVLEQLGISYSGVRQKEINHQITWKQICRGCKREVDEKYNECPYCGSELKLVSDGEKDLN